MDKEGILMNWEMKPTSWEMENLVFGGKGETSHLHNHGHGYGHGHGHGGEVLFLGGEKQQQMKGSSCTVDLQLGRLGDFGDGFGDFKVSTRGSGTSSMAISPGSSRRSRSSSSNNQAAACIVDDCNADLSNCKDYHKRHKVCEAHSKAVKVTVEGHEKRFCQQCSKFHALSEFDEVKRSCRKRLEGHNKRRRKSQPDLSSGSLVHTIQGHGFRSYINQHGLSNVVREHGWAAGFIKPEEDSMYNRQPPQQQQMVATNRPQPFLRSSSSYYKGGGKQFPFFQGSDVKPTAKSLEMFASQTHMSTAASSLESNSINSDCALSLLSSSPQSSGLTLNSIDQIPMALPLVQGIQYSNMDRYHSDKMLPMNCSPNGVPCPMMDVDQVSPMLISNQDNSEYHSQGMVHDMGNSRTGVLQPLHFWQ